MLLLPFTFRILYVPPPINVPLPINGVGACCDCSACAPDLRFSNISCCSCCVVNITSCGTCSLLLLGLGASTVVCLLLLHPLLLVLRVLPHLLHLPACKGLPTCSSCPPLPKASAAFPSLPPPAHAVDPCCQNKLGQKTPTKAHVAWQYASKHVPLYRYHPAPPQKPNHFPSNLWQMPATHTPSYSQTFG